MALYQRNTGALTATPGLSLVPKIKYEHVYLTSFSKMRVDLAAQVCYLVPHSLTMFIQDISLYG